MKLYRVDLRQSDGESHGFQYFSNKVDAQRAVRTWADNEPPGKAEIEEINVEPTRAGILTALSLYGSHADNG